MSLDLVERGYAGKVLLLPGLGFGNAIFNRLGLERDYILVREPVTELSPIDISGEIEERIGERISILGWSLGAVIAVKVAELLGDMVERVVLVSTRRVYPLEQIGELEAALQRDRRQGLVSFYRGCFAGQKQDYRWFAQELEEEFVSFWGLEQLLKGLRDLAAPFPVLGYDHPFDVYMLHGSRDTVAPLAESARPSARARLKVVRAGHLPFLSHDGTMFLRSVL